MDQREKKRKQNAAALLPILVFYIICQKQILNGVVNGAVK